MGLFQGWATILITRLIVILKVINFEYIPDSLTESQNNYLNKV